MDFSVLVQCMMFWNSPIFSFYYWSYKNNWYAILLLLQYIGCHRQELKQYSIFSFKFGSWIDRNCIAYMYMLTCTCILSKWIMELNTTAILHFFFIINQYFNLWQLRACSSNQWFKGFFSHKDRIDFDDCFNSVIIFLHHCIIEKKIIQFWCAFHIFPVKDDLSAYAHIIF